MLKSSTGTGPRLRDMRRACCCDRTGRVAGGRRGAGNGARTGSVVDDAREQLAARAKAPGADTVVTVRYTNKPTDHPEAWMAFGKIVRLE